MESLQSNVTATKTDRVLLRSLSWTGNCYVAPAGLKLGVLLFQPQRCCDYSHAISINLFNRISIIIFQVATLKARPKGQCPEPYLGKLSH